MRRPALTCAAALATAGCAHPAVAPRGAPSVTIARPIVVASDAIGGEVAAYAVFANSGPATGVVGAECTCAEQIELHVVGVEHGMAEAWPLALPAGEDTAVEPPGRRMHFMLMGLKQPIALGETVRLRFRLESGEWIETDFVGVGNSTEAWRAFEERDGS